MRVTLLKSKILRAVITDARLDYEGSLAIDEKLMEKCNLLPYEKILVGNINNGNRFETYAIPAPAGTGTISLNGAAARLGEIQDRIVIMSFIDLDINKAKTWKPCIVVIGENNTKTIPHNSKNTGI